MKFAPHDWPAISALLDEALQLPPAHRGPWLEALPEYARAYRDTLANLLDDYVRVETQDFLKTLPKLDPAGASASSDGTELTRSVEPYRLLREIGRGGMGSVWLAERSDGLLKRPVALKLPHPGLATRTFSERLARERDILASLVHPNIARLYDAGVTPEGQPFIALEYVPGRTLTEHCDAARLGLHARIELFLQILAAVQFAHAHLVIHRDLKPSNVMVTSDGQVRLLDFGIAKLITDGVAKETELTQLGGSALTPDYASPEQIGGQAITTASDVYSLGVLLYELLTGRRPYRLKRDSRAALEEAILAADVHKPSDVAGDEAHAHARGMSARKLARALRGDLDTITLKALKKPTGERYGSVEAFAQDLKRHLQGEAVHARADSTWYRARRFIGRNRLAAAAAFSVLTALIAGTSIALWQAREAREQARVAKIEARTAQAVQSFMEDIFNANSADQADPARARQTTARELLDIGAAKIDSGLQDAPEARIRMLRRLATLYASLGLPDRTVPLMRKAVEATRRQHGDHSPQVAEVLIELAAALEQADISAEQAESALGEAQKILDDAGDSRSVVRGKLYLARGRHDNKGNSQRAIVELGKAVDVLRDHPSSADLVAALELRGITRGMIGEPHAAIDDLSEAIQLASLPQSQSKGELSELYSQVGTNQNRIQDVEGAERSYRAAIDMARESNPSDNVQSAEALRRFGYFLFQTSRTAEGLAVAKQCAEMVQRLKTTLHSTSVALPRGMLVYASALMARGRLEDSLHENLAAAGAWQEQSGATRIDAELLEQRASVLTDLGRYGEAGGALDKALSIRTRLGDLRSPLLLSYYFATRARLLALRGDFDAAQATLRQLSVPPASAGTVSTQEAFREILRSEIALERQDREQAIQFASRALAMVRESRLRPYWKLHEARASLTLGKAQLGAGRPKQALEPLQQAFQLGTELFDRQRSPALADSQVALASCLLQLHRGGEATALLRQAQAIHASYEQLGEHYRRSLRELEARIGRSS